MLPYNCGKHWLHYPQAIFICDGREKVRREIRRLKIRKQKQKGFVPQAYGANSSFYLHFRARWLLAIRNLKHLIIIMSSFEHRNIELPSQSTLIMNQFIWAISWITPPPIPLSLILRGLDSSWLITILGFIGNNVSRVGEHIIVRHHYKFIPRLESWVTCTMASSTLIYI